MIISYAAERKKLMREHVALREQCRIAGMSEEKIQELMEADWKQVCRDIAFYRHSQQLDSVDDFGEEARNPYLRRFGAHLTVDPPEVEDQFSWMDRILVEPIATELHKLTIDQKNLLTLLFKFELTRTEICKTYDVPKSTLSKTITQLLDALKSGTVNTVYPQNRLRIMQDNERSKQSSRGRIPVIKKNIICLCRTCKNEYLSAGYRLRKVQDYQLTTEICTHCNYRRGFDYYIPDEKYSTKVKCTNVKRTIK